MMDEKGVNLPIYKANMQHKEKDYSTQEGHNEYY